MKRSDASGNTTAKQPPKTDTGRHPDTDEAARLYRILFDQCPYGIVVSDTQGKILDFNEIAHRNLGYTREEFSNLSLADIDPAGAPAELQALIELILSKGGAEFDVKHMTRQGKIKDVHVIARPLVLSGQTLVHSIWHDITEKKIAERTLLKTKGELEALIQTMPDMVFVKDADGRCVMTNRIAEECFGRSREWFSGKTNDELMPAATAELCNRSDSEAITKGYPIHAEEQFTDKGDNTLFLDTIKAPFFDSDGNLSGLLCVARDVTERKRAEELLEQAAARATEEKNKFEAMISAIGDGVSIRDTDYRILFENKKQKELLGGNEGQHCYRAYHSRNSICEECLVALCFADGMIHKGVLTRRKGDETVYYEVTASPLRNHKGEIMAGIEVLRDITERRHAEESLRISEARLSEAQAIAHVGNWEWDISTGAVYWSDELYRIYGYEPHEISPDYRLIVDAMRSDSREEFIKAIDAAIKGEKPFEMDYTFFRKNGSEAVLHTIGRVVHDNHGDPERMYGTVQEVTIQKRIENALRESEEKFRSIFDSASDGILIADTLTKRFRAANRTICSMLGYGKEEIIDLGIDDIHPAEDLPWVLDAFEKQARGEINIAESLPMLKKDGTVFYADVSSAITTLEGMQCIIGVFRDITDRKRAEERLRQSLKEKETLVREIHHRVKNNMAVVSSLLDLQSKHTRNEEVKRLLRESQQRVKSMALVHEKLYGTADLAAIDFKDYVDSIVHQIINLYHVDNNLITTDIDIEDIHLDLESAIPCALIINELLTNVFKYAFPGNIKGKLVTNFRKADDIYTLIIRDNGVGLPDDLDYRQPNTLGLQIVTVLTRQLGGSLRVRSDKGTEMVITFPAKKG